MSETAWAMSGATPTEEQVLVVIVRGGLFGLERVVGLLRRRAPRIETLNVTSGERDGALRVTLHLRCPHAVAAQVAAHLRKLTDVDWAATFAASSGEAALVREFALIRVACTPATRRDVVDAAQLFGAHAVDANGDSITLEITGTPDTVEQLLNILRPNGVIEVARTGRVAIPRGVRPTDAQREEDAPVDA
jgi:acetolactate synthase I/III small subunit